MRLQVLVYSVVEARKRWTSDHPLSNVKDFLKHFKNCEIRVR